MEINVSGVVIYAAKPPAIPPITAFSREVKSVVAFAGLNVS